MVRLVLACTVLAPSMGPAVRALGQDHHRDLLSEGIVRDTHGDGEERLHRAYRLIRDAQAYCKPALAIRHTLYLGLIEHNGLRDPMAMLPFAGERHARRLHS